VVCRDADFGRGLADAVAPKRLLLVRRTVGFPAAGNPNCPRSDILALPSSRIGTREIDARGAAHVSRDGCLGFPKWKRGAGAIAYRMMAFSRVPQVWGFRTGGTTVDSRVPRGAPGERATSSDLQLPHQEVLP
jgi:hypothetical protein